MLTKRLPSYHMSVHTPRMVWLLTAMVMACAIGGILIAYKKYNAGRERDEKLESSFIYRLLANQYYIPKLYEEFITKPYAMISEKMWKEIDLKVVDRTVDGIAHFLYKSGDVSRRMQSGNLSHYLNWMAVGAVALLLAAAIAAMIG